ncbi:cytochrome P450 [Paraburkholderia tropica]|uniref:cytochrome P450 n=1 Tax=Paraburkholderia tropica TaxID=92647 RepID=UPI00158FFA6B|nr:cytochrome P450 [Paraburkholderia tropica]
MTTIADTAVGEKDLVRAFDHYNVRIDIDGSPSTYIEAIRDQFAAGSKVLRSEKYDGFWVVGGHPECLEILQNVEVFSNEGNIFPKYETGGALLMMAEQDDPDHAKYRQMVSGPFTPLRARAIAQQVKHQANALIDTFVGKGEVNATTVFANELPGRITAAFLGLPEDHGPMYRDWVTTMARGHVDDPEGAKVKMKAMADYVQNIVDERRKNPGGTDVFSNIINTEYDGQLLSDGELLSFFVILLIGGLENTSRTISASVWRLAWDLDLRRRVLANPSLIPGMVEEIMRLYTGPAPCRLIKQDIEFHGVKMKEGETVMTLSSVANRDPRVFDRPDFLIPERTSNPHLSLGHGIHRCLGAHIVRVQVKAALEEFLKRIPNFTLDRGEGKQLEWEGGQAAGFTSVPIIV